MSSARRRRGIVLSCSAAALLLAAGCRTSPRRGGTATPPPAEPTAAGATADVRDANGLIEVDDGEEEPGPKEVVEVELKPFGLAERDLVVGGARRRAAALRLNTELVRRVALRARDVREATLVLSCKSVVPRLEVIARGKAKNGERVSLADREPLRAFRLAAGEELVVTVWKPAWHWNGGATLGGVTIARLGPGGTRSEATLPAEFTGGRAETALGTFALVGLFNRDKFPDCASRVPASPGAKPGEHTIPGASGVGLAFRDGSVHFHTNGRADWNAGYGWAPALVFTPAPFDELRTRALSLSRAPARGGVYSLEGTLAFRCAKPDHDVAWLVGRQVAAGGPLTGTTLSLHRLLRAPGDAPGDAQDASPVPGTHYEGEPLARAEIAADGVRKPVEVTFPVAPALRAWLSGEAEDHGLLLVAGRAGLRRAEAAAAAQAGGTPPPVQILKEMKGKVTVARRRKHLLFDHEVKPRPGVYATVKDGRLYYGGRRLRLWGSVGPARAERLRRLGFNCNRTWNQKDFYTDESAKRGKAMESARGDGSSLDRFDRHMADLKANGMFVMFATTVGQGMPMKPLLRDDSWLAGGEDWSEWKGACAKAGGETYRLAYVDDRLWRARLRHAENVFTHRNPYTGKKYAEEEIIALVEINNEAGTIRNWLERGFGKWPGYFRRLLRRRWNRWLAVRYGGEPRLRAAWGRLEVGESLARETVRPAPVLSERGKFPRARQVDFVRFLYELVDSRNQEYRAFCRSLAPEGVGVNVVPFSFDSQYRPSIPWAYTNWLGDTSTVSMYFWSNGTTLGRPPGLYVLDSHRLADRLSAIYETQRGRPSPYRTEYPYALSAMTGWQDFDVVVWHGNWIGDRPDEEVLALGAMPPTTSHYWTAVHLEGDPVMSSAVAMAGRLFLGGHVGPAPRPAVYTVGRDAIFSLDTFHGIGGREMSHNTFTRGTKIVFQPDGPGGVLLDGKPREKMDAVSGPVRTGDGVLWDWPSERLIIDTPGAKAYVGKTVPFHRFRDGITVSGFETPFIALALVSADGRPLTGADACDRAYVCATFDAKNTGFEYDYGCSGGPVEQAKAVKSRGRPPVVVDEVSYTVSFPFEAAGRFTTYDFAMRRSGAFRLAGNTLRRRGQTDWMGVIEFARRGEAAEPVRDPSPGAAGEGERAGAEAPETTDPRLAAVPNPLPGLSWGDGYRRAHRLLRDGAMRKARVGPEDLGDAAGKRIRVDEAEFLMDTPASVEIVFHRGRMTRIDVEFTQAPSFLELVARFEKAYGAPRQKKITANAFERSEARWEVGKPGGTLVVLASETQGVVRVAYELKR